jgi:hypothetical protein
MRTRRGIEDSTRFRRSVERAPDVVCDRDGVNRREVERDRDLRAETDAGLLTERTVEREAKRTICRV